MEEKKMTKIKIGSIIHLQNVFENGVANGGYLEARGSLSDIPVITRFPYPNGLSFVFTHESKDRFQGSGSWEIVSANDAKQPDDQLESGDEIYLLNRHTSAEYLDTFEWVFNLDPFKEYPMTIGVFTAGVPDRGGGVSGTWIVELADQPEASGQVISENATIRLKNKYPGAGYLHTWEEVAKHPLVVDGEKPFQLYEGERLFVFTSASSPMEKGSNEWIITLSETNGDVAPDDQPNYTDYYIWRDLNGTWIDSGIFRLNQPIFVLNVTSEDEGETLEGDVTYVGKETKKDVKVTWDEYTTYSDAGKSGHVWLLGGRVSQKVTSLLISSDDNGRSIKGQIIYAGTQEPVVFRGRKASTKLQYDFFKADLWEGRIESVSQALERTVKDFGKVIFSAGGISPEKLTEIINEAGGQTPAFLIDQLVSLEGENNSDNYEFLNEQIKKLLRDAFEPLLKLERLERKENQEGIYITINNEYLHLNQWLLDLLQQPLPSPQTVSTVSNEGYDYEYHVTQLLNIYTLWHEMKEFWETFQTQARQAIGAFEARQILPPAYWIRTCIQEFATDIEIIQRAIQQRGGTPNTQANTLLITDKLALMALAPFKSFFSTASDITPIDITPITYFSEMMHIRRLPYASRFVMVGLGYELALPEKPSQAYPGQPAAAAFTPFELMAIPHEVGHFIYQHAVLKESAKGLDAYLNNGLSSDSEIVTFADLSHQLLAENPYYHWCEEIFADLYGCVIAGPLTALGLLAYLVTDNQSHVLTDDGEHPVPMLRLFFVSEMLRFLSAEKSDWYKRYDYNFLEAAQSLDESWTAILERWDYVIDDMAGGRPLRIKLPGQSEEHQESFINVDTALENVREIIQVFAEVLFKESELASELVPGDEDITTFLWCQKEGPLADFIQQINKLTAPDFIDRAKSHHHLSKKDSQDEQIDYDAEKIDVYEQTAIFKAIAKRWKDSGPVGLGGHG
ncbi:MAG: hypothetical protein AAF702_43860 [Chloroflexota bacterium]